ncbi:TRAP transporter TatT component family protein [Candidatus Bipolaricaulota bacterium]|nr:TRAP transporter TatT component family protein [Candidatus Bipolaricaulota bacterium]
MSRGWVLALLVLLAGVPGASQSVDELVAQAQALLPNRYIPENLKLAIDLLEQALALAPERVDLMALLTQLHYELGVISEDPEDKRRQFRRGADLGFAALGLGSLAEAEGTPTEEFVARIEEADSVAALYWTAKCWGMVVETGGILAQLRAFWVGMPGKIRAMYLRAIELDETYFGGGPHEDYGALLVSLAKFRLYGATLEEAKAHFDRAVELAGQVGYLIPFITYAERYAVRVGDRALFEELLRFVLAAPIGDWPFWNRQAKVQAEALLAKADELFR